MKPPPPLSARVAEELVDWLNYAARKYPRIVATLAMQQIQIRLEELGDSDFPVDWEPRLGFAFRTNGGDPAVSFVELLSLAFQSKAQLFGGLQARFDRDGVRFASSVYSTPEKGVHPCN